MKKILFILITFLCLHNSTWGQSGKWAIQFNAALKNVHSYKSADKSFLEISYGLGNNYSMIHRATNEIINIYPGYWGYVSTGIRDYEMNQSIWGLELYSKLEQSGHSDPGKDEEAYPAFSSHPSDGLISYTYTRLCDGECQPSQRLFRGWGGYIDIYVFPSKVNIAYKSAGTDKYLPTHDKVEIKAPKGYAPNVYKWVYFNKDENKWKEFYNTKLRGEQEIEISAEDVYGPNFLDIMFKYPFTDIALEFLVYDNIKGPNTLGYSNILSLDNIPSSPHIEDVKFQLPTCHKNDDAKLFVHFDRELYDSEKLYLSTDGDRFKYRIVMNPGTKIAEIQGLAADTCSIRLLGSYKVNTTDSIKTYTNGNKHEFEIRIPERPAISLESITQTPVHCFGGKDGKILVKARGGTGIFDALLYKNDLYQDSIRFSTNSTAEFKKLNIGRYEVLIQDSNGCIWDTSGNPVVGTINVTEPNDNVVILSHRHEEPKGFGLSDGWAQITFKGGTSSSYNVIWKDSLNNVIPNTITPDGSTFISKAENIRSSTYFVTVQDANYPLVDPRTEENLCGCTDTISFFVEEPPKLEVALNQHRYVTCNGDKNGQVVAHATGGRPHLSGRPYTYEWVKVEELSLVPTNQIDSIFTELYSGYYRVKITDRNGITATSDDYHLVEPDPLVVTTNVLQNITCSGERIGKMEAIATGGTPPYTYIWSNNDTTRVINNLTQGNYIVGVRDSRYAENITGHYCFAQAVDSIIAPNPIKLNPKVKNPICFGYSNGEIKLNVTGGIPPYSYVWEDGATTATKSNLPRGNYHVRVSDTNGCFMEEDFTLTEPEKVVVDLGKDFILCKGQSINVNGSLSIDGMSYKWTDAANNVLSANADLNINKAGIYKLTAITVDGCSGIDEIKVEESDDIVIPDFIMATEVANNTGYYAVNITKTNVDSISWIIPEDVIIQEKQPDRIELLFPRNGSYIIGMAAHKNRCTDVLYKTISVVDKSNLQEDTSEEPFLKSFVVTPNPNDGNFKVIVELREPASYKLMLYNFNGVLVDTKSINNKMYESTTFNISGKGTGFYFLKLTSPKITSVFKVLIQQ